METLSRDPKRDASSVSSRSGQFILSQNSTVRVASSKCRVMTLSVLEETVASVSMAKESWESGMSWYRNEISDSFVHARTSKCSPSSIVILSSDVSDQLLIDILGTYQGRGRSCKDIHTTTRATDSTEAKYSLPVPQFCA